jgi:hypothetical protein
VHLGGELTPACGSYAAAEWGAATGVTTWAAARFLADSIDLAVRVRAEQEVWIDHTADDHADIAGTLDTIDAHRLDTRLDERARLLGYSGYCNAPGCRHPAQPHLRVPPWWARRRLRPHRPWPHGPTCTCNLGPLCQHHHHIKTHGTWTLTKTAPGVFQWRSPTGHTYLVEPETTRRS